MKRSIRRLIMLISLITASGCGEVNHSSLPHHLIPEGTPWIRTIPEPQRTFYVSPSGAGNAGSEDTPMNRETAVTLSMPGDLFLLRDGDYAGAFKMRKDATEDAPVVFKACKGEHVKITGGFEISGDYTYILGMEFTDPAETSQQGTLSITADGVMIINNVIHAEGYGTSLSSWNRPHQIIYGNIIYHGHHNIYTQNSAENGYRYFVNNISMDAKTDSNGSNGPFEFHAYAEGGDISSFYLFNNIFAHTSSGKGRLLIGGRNSTPNDLHVLIGNYLYNTRLQMGYRRPVQAFVSGNCLADSDFYYEWFWGEGESRFPNPPVIAVTDNRIIMTDSGRRHVNVRTSAYTGNDQRSDGIPKLRPGDIWDCNVYSPDFSGRIEAAGSSKNVTELDRWRWETSVRGNTFDRKGKVIPSPDKAEVVLIPNQYEKGRAHLAVFNYGKEEYADADLSQVLSAGSSFRIMNVKDAFGTPAVSDVYNGSPVSIRVDRAFFSVFLVVSDG